MTADALAVVQFLFGGIWSLFTSWHIPGTAVTPASLGLFTLMVGVVIRFVKRLLDNQGGDGN